MKLRATIEIDLEVDDLMGVHTVMKEIEKDVAPLGKKYDNVNVFVRERRMLKKAKIVGKPNKEFFNSALNDMGFGPKEVVMFGDDLINDISGAQELDIPGILVKTGKYHKGMLESSSIIPNGFLESIADLPKIISNGEQLWNMLM